MTTIKSRPDLVVVSLGGGVQSTVMLMMGGTGRFGLVPDVAIFADTGNEPPEVYNMIEWLTDNQPVEIQVVRAKQPILESVRAGADPSGAAAGTMVPFYTLDENGQRGKGFRFCTQNWKIRPIQSEIRRRLSRKRINRDMNIHVEQWIGISTDEIERVSTSGLHWVENRHPLIEDGISRNDCLSWWAENYPSAPPLAKSSCVICPYRSNAEWREMQRTHPELIAQAADAEREHQRVQDERALGKPMKHFLHRRYKPLLDAIAETETEADDAFLRAEECTGYCWT